MEKGFSAIEIWADDHLKYANRRIETVKEARKNGELSNTDVHMAVCRARIEIELITDLIIFMDEVKDYE